MAQDPTDTGTSQALLDRLVHSRLPRTLELKQRVDAGDRLTDTDLEFLKDLLEIPFTPGSRRDTCFGG